jgi:hypothetical protein
MKKASVVILLLSFLMWSSIIAINASAQNSATACAGVEECYKAECTGSGSCTSQSDPGMCEGSCNCDGENDGPPQFCWPMY